MVTAPEENEKIRCTYLVDLSSKNTGQKFADIFGEDFQKFLDEKKGIYGSMSGHIHFCDILNFNEDAEKHLYAQLNSIRVLQRDNECFTPLLIKLQGIIRNKNSNWEQKNFLFQEVFKDYIPILPENRVPSFLFPSDFSYNDKIILNDRRSQNTYLTSESFSNIENTRNALAIAISAQGQKARQNYIKSYFGCKTIKQKIIDENRSDFQSWSGWRKSADILDFD